MRKASALFAPLRLLFKNLFPIVAAVTLVACGGGSSPPKDTVRPITGATPQSVGGIWTSQYTETTGTRAGDVINAQTIVSEVGDYFTYIQDTTTGCAGIASGGLSLNGTSVTGSETAAIIRYTSSVGLGTDCSYPDGSFTATGTLTGTVTPQASLMLTTTDTTFAGDALPSNSISFTFSSMYLNPSSLATVAGNYSHSGSTMTIDATGSIFEQAPNGCISSGQIYIVDPSYNAYLIQLHFMNCTGLTANIDGVTARGIVMLDTSKTPATLVGGISAIAEGLPFLEVFNLPKM